MTPFQIRYWDDPVLSTVCEPVSREEFGSPELEALGQRLLLTMNHFNGIGLAAPQVGITRRVFVMNYPEPLVVCNPSIVFDSGALVYEREGCLSIPGIYEQVGRAQKASMVYTSLNGDEKVISLSDMAARVAAHEQDHLNGIMFFDRSRMSKQMSKKLLREWNKIKHKVGA